ncbi:protein FAM177A1 [Parasteatoda tepidariorum]|uniref:protein FAM177A1 n=1 Tax=Parasteatoda tepidariorum TaxID=114398 RepID=UPI00077FDDB6|nr:protein FAM177A1 [Parasteatoda tepidariorum]
MTTTEKESFTEVNLMDLQRKKAPKRLIYFSDGILEEFSSDEEEVVDAQGKESQSVVDPSSLKWIPYFEYLLWMFGSRTLAVCDYLGEHLAWFLGITSPKYQYELDLYEKITKEEEELQKHIKAENAGWTTSEDQQNTVDFQPKSNVIETKLRNAGTVSNEV